jgi:hypothetical protein
MLGASSDKGDQGRCSSGIMRKHLAKSSSLDLERHLPAPGWRRWSARSKAAVVIAVRSGKLGRVEAYDRYMLSDEELSGWEEAFDRDGIAGLQAKRR